MKTLLCLLTLAFSSIAFGGTSGIVFIYQPLHTLGTDQEPAILVTKIPIIADAVTETILAHIAAPNKLLQRKPAYAEDSNLLSSLGIGINAELVEVAGAGQYAITLDLTRMKLATPYELAAEDVVKAAVDCIRRTLNDAGEKTPWKGRMVPSGRSMRPSIPAGRRSGERVA